MDDRHRGSSRLVAALLAVLLVVPSAVAWARTPGGERVTGHPGVAGFRHRAEVDRVTYAEDDPVVLTYRVCRSRPWPTRTNTSFQVEFRVVDEVGRVVADTTHRVYPLVLAPVWWWPGGCRTAGPVWDQHVWNQDPADDEGRSLGGWPVRGDRVEPGSYRFEVWWEASAGGEPDEQVPSPIVTAPFGIAP